MNSLSVQTDSNEPLLVGAAIGDHIDRIEAKTANDSCRGQRRSRPSLCLTKLWARYALAIVPAPGAWRWQAVSSTIQVTSND